MRIKQPPSRENRNISILDLMAYMRRFPTSAWVSLFHRLSGALLFILLPAIIWTFDTAMSSEDSFVELQSVFEIGLWALPGWSLKLVVLAVLWSYLHHLTAGLRFLFLDVNHHAADKQRSGWSARWVLIVSVGLTVVLGAKLFGLY